MLKEHISLNLNFVTVKTVYKLMQKYNSKT